MSLCPSLLWSGAEAPSSTFVTLNQPHYQYPSILVKYVLSSLKAEAAQKIRGDNEWKHLAVISSHRVRPASLGLDTVNLICVTAVKNWPEWGISHL